MPTYRAQVVLPFFTNLPSDVITNTLHFDPLTPLDFPGTIAAVMPALTEFYGLLYVGSRGIATYVNGAAATVRWYDLSQPEPRAPTIVPLGVTFASTTSKVPTEVSMVLSFQAPQVSGSPQARRRGRIYLGGLTDAWLAPGTGATFPRFDPVVVTGVANAASEFLDDVRDAGVEWTVWSVRDQASSIITNGWVDNTPDTQRRRGVLPTARTLWVQGS